MNNVTIISDPGIDDCIALLLLYKLNAKAHNCIISSFGNASEEICSLNAKEFIAFVAKSWSFMHGSMLPKNGFVEHAWPDYFHGPDGVWGVHPKTNISLIKTVAMYPKNKFLMSLAPMTDACNVLKQTLLNKAVIMGGAFTVEGNETKYAETNIAFDPDSANDFFNDCTNIFVQVVPLDVTRKVFWSLEMVHSIPESNGINKWIKTLLLTWFKKYSHEREKSFNLHDPLAVYLSWFSQKAQWRNSGISVITEGEQRGKTIFNDNRPCCSVALGLSQPQNIANDIFKLVFK